MLYGLQLILLCISCVSCGTGCPIGTYLRGGTCERCVPECRSGQIRIAKCGNVTDRFICQCPYNKYWDGNLALCKLCETCGPAEIISKNCSHSHNRKCSKCLKGTFVKTIFECHRCSHCLEGDVVKKACRATNDTVCAKQDSSFISITNRPVVTLTQPEDNHIEENNTTVTILAIVVALVLVALILVCLCWHCSPRKKMSKFPESSLTDDSEIDDLVKKKPPPPPVRDNGLMFRLLNPQVVEELCLLLNPDILKNWKMLAALLGYQQCRIQHFKLYKGESCQKLFEEWSTERGSTVFVLYNHLLAMKRDDCTELLRKCLEENPV